MQKIVINKIHGGFGLSIAAFKEYYKCKTGKEVHAYVQTKYEHKDGITEFTNVNNYRFDYKCLLCIHYSTLDKEKITRDEINNSYVSDSDIGRDDPILIDLVEKMGRCSWGDSAELKIVEIPDNIKWQIDEYDGIEWVAEIHRAWD